MQYRIKLRNKINLSLPKGAILSLKGASCTLLRKISRDNLLFAESDEDLSPLFNALAAVTEVDVLVLDGSSNILSFRVPKGSRCRPYCHNGRLIRSSGKTGEDDDIISLSWNCHLLALAAVYND